MLHDGRLNTDQVAVLTEGLISQGISGLYVCGSTGEGVSMSTQERKDVASSFVSATARRVPVLVQVGHNSITESRALAAHAQEIGAEAISATCPSYFKIDSVDVLLSTMAEIAAAAPESPFYYYHIPALTGSGLDMVDFLQRAGDRIPNLAGLKYTAPTLHEFQMCRSIDDGRYDVVWGLDEMLLSALAVGAEAGIGSTYNIATGLYRRVIDSFDSGNLNEARRCQLLSVQMIREMAAFPFHAAMKEVLRMQGIDCGHCRLPHPRLQPEQTTELRKRLESIGFFEWAQTG